jgi:metal-responsive CopG/Arc/MetJ family transcriptional regulator
MSAPISDELLRSLAASGSKTLAVSDYNSRERLIQDLSRLLLAEREWVRELERERDFIKGVLGWSAEKLREALEAARR